MKAWGLDGLSIFKEIEKGPVRNLFFFIRFPFYLLWAEKQSDATHHTLPDYANLYYIASYDGNLNTCVSSFEFNHERKK